MTMLKKIYTILFALVVLFCSCGTEENTPELPGTDGNGSGGNSGGGAIELPVYPVPDRSNVPAFPGAHGAGRYVTRQQRML